MNRKMIIIILLITLSICIIVISSFTIIFNIHIIENKFRYNYEVIINTNETNSLTLYLPIPIDINNEEIVASEMITKIKILYGDANISYIETEYGKALKLSFKGNVHLKAFGEKSVSNWKDEDYDYNILSLQNTTGRNDYYYYGLNTIPYFIWGDGISDENISIGIDIYAYFGNSRDVTKSTISGNISNNGWQIIYGSHQNIVV